MGEEWFIPLRKYRGSAVEARREGWRNPWNPIKAPLHNRSARRETTLEFYADCRGPLRGRRNVGRVAVCQPHVAQGMVEPMAQALNGSRRAVDNIAVIADCTGEEMASAIFSAFLHDLHDLQKYTKSALIPSCMEQKRSQYSNSPLSGLGRASRAQLAAVLRKSTGTVTPVAAAEILGLPRREAAKLLSRWAMQGWLRRVRRGIYVPVPLESERADMSPEDAWVIAETAFAPCFISGWSAAEYWGLTEQVFRTVLVSTTRRPRNRAPRMAGINFRLRTVGDEAFFGLKTVWRGRARVQVTDPSRTIVDLLLDPSLGGGLRSSVDMLQSYLASKEHRNVGQVVSYARTLGVGAVFKRLGYLLERFAPEEQAAIEQCARALTQGNARLDPALPAKRLVTAWRLWLPEGWKAQ